MKIEKTDIFCWFLFVSASVSFSIKWPAILPRYSLYDLSSNGLRAIKSAKCCRLFTFIEMNLYEKGLLGIYRKPLTKLFLKSCIVSVSLGFFDFCGFQKHIFYRLPVFTKKCGEQQAYWRVQNIPKKVLSFVDKILVNFLTINKEYVTSDSKKNLDKLQ